MRLVDADALEKEMCSGCEYNKSKYANCDDCAIANAPTIDAEPVKHGENISENGFLCSVCSFGDFGGFHGYEPNYCPNCGAKMKEDKNGNME